MKRNPWAISVAVLVLVALVWGSFALGRWGAATGPRDPERSVVTTPRPGIQRLALGHGNGLQEVTVVVDEHWKVQDPAELARWASAVAWNRTRPTSGDMDMVVLLVTATSQEGVTPRDYFGYLGWFEPVPPSYIRDSGTPSTIPLPPIPEGTPSGAQPSGDETIDWDPQPRGTLLGLTPSGTGITLRTDRNSGAIDAYYPGANLPRVSLATYWAQVFTTAAHRDKAVAEDLAPNALVKAP